MKNRLPKSKMVNNVIFFFVLLLVIAFFFPFRKLEKIHNLSSQKEPMLMENIYLAEDPIKLDQDLEGKWKFQTGDNPQWKSQAFDDNHWNEIYVPGYWEHQGYADYDGIAWYRKGIKVEGRLRSEKLVLLLGKIDDIDQVYVNSQLVGFTGEGWNQEELYIKGSEWQELRGYYLPEGIFNSNGNNVISIRVYDDKIDGGIHEGPIGLITQKNYIAYWRKRKQSNKRKRF